MKIKVSCDKYIRYPIGILTFHYFRTAVCAADDVNVIHARSYQRNRLRDFSSRSRGKPRHRKEKFERNA